MNAPILRSAARSFLPLFLLFSLILLLNGHDDPGGGFAGGLLAACAFVIHALAHDVPSARRLLVVRPSTLIAVGLATATLSGCLALFAGDPFLTSQWVTLPGGAAVGTPLGFEVGVYLVVLGSSLAVLFGFQEIG